MDDVIEWGDIGGSAGRDTDGWGRDGEMGGGERDRRIGLCTDTAEADGEGGDIGEREREEAEGNPAGRGSDRRGDVEEAGSGGRDGDLQHVWANRMHSGCDSELSEWTKGRSEDRERVSECEVVCVG